ncbi:hypothetical protein ACJZUN_000669 [Campylobacter upsaliensis]
MKTDTLKKSLLDYAIKGKLTAKFRRENSGLNAFDELEIYNDKIREKRKNLEKELKTLESKLKKAPTRHCERAKRAWQSTSNAESTNQTRAKISNSNSKKRAYKMQRNHAVKP